MELEKYYWTFPYKLLSDECLANVRKYALELAQDKSIYGIKGQEIYEASLRMGQAIFDKFPEVKALEDNCKLELTSKILFVYKGAYAVPAHRDAQLPRISVLYFPILPEEDYSGVIFWDEQVFPDENKELHKVFNTCQPDNIQPPHACIAGGDGKAFIFDAQQMHAVKSPYTGIRINFQFSFAQPYNVVLKLAKANKLFRHLS